MGLVYRFVGTPQDSAQVRKDFEAGKEIPKVTSTPRKQTHYEHPNFDKMSNEIIDQAIDAGFRKQQINTTNWYERSAPKSIYDVPWFNNN